MAYPDTNQERRTRVDPYRDPDAIDTRSSFNWPLVLGVAVAALLAMALLGSFPGPTSDRPPSPPEKP